MQTKDEKFTMVYEQYWLHARHQELQRLGFTNIYAVIVAGVFTFFNTFKEPNTIIFLFLMGFLMILSLLGYLMTYSWNFPFVIYSRLAEEIAICEWNLPGNYQRFAKYGSEYKKDIGLEFIIAYMTKLNVDNKLIVNINDGIKFIFNISAARTFIAFYSVMTGFFIALIFKIIYSISNFVIILMLLSISIIFYSYYLYLEKAQLEEFIRLFEERIIVCQEKRA